MKSNSALLVLGLATAGSYLLAANVDLTKLPPPSDKKGVTYANDIRPIFETSCFRCHGTERPKAGLRLDSLEGVLKGSKEGKVILPGKSEKSQLVIAVARLDEEMAMPPKPKQGRRGGPGGPPSGASGDGRPPGANGPSGAQPPGGPPGAVGPMPKPLTSEQVGLIRAWVDQGAR